jgi:hypothetical protein
MEKTDKYTKFILTAIALGLFLNAGVDIIKPAKADDSSYIISRILNCIDSSTIAPTGGDYYYISLRCRN